MREVQRSPAPDFFGGLRAKYQKWDDIASKDRRDIRDALASKDFGRICAYCEQPCFPPSAPTEDDEKGCNPLRPGRLTDEETIDHFRPRSRCPDLWIDWDNLIYACYRCNQSKCDQWPELDDKVNTDFSIGYLSYTPVTEYVGPNASSGQRPAQDFFDFPIDADTGKLVPELVPAASVEHGGVLSTLEQSRALRTIKDLDLNDERSGLGEYDQKHLFQRRRAFVELLKGRLDS